MAGDSVLLIGSNKSVSKPPFPVFIDCLRSKHFLENGRDSMDIEDSRIDPGETEIRRILSYHSSANVLDLRLKLLNCLMCSGQGGS